jgi:recombinational DNA repair protein RecR
VNNIINIKNNHHKYCSICWKEKEKELWKEASKKYRDKKQIVIV